MKMHRIRVLGVGILGLALLAAACGDDEEPTVGGGGGGQARGTLTIGAFNFPESAILANMYAGALRNDGYTVNVRANLGSREVVTPALERGEIDLYPGYAATDLEFFNKGAGEATPDAKATVDKLNSRIDPNGLVALEPSPAIDQNVFVVTKATSDRLRARRVSDLAAQASQLSLGGPPECPVRPYCIPGLEQKYGIKFGTFKPLDSGGPLTIAALERGEVDVALLFSSDGAILAKGFVILEDDKKLQNADNVVPIMRKQAATSEARTVLNRVSAALTTEELIELNKRANVDKEDPDRLAQDWLRQNGFTK
jgi:osmoprotectant transport system substrate-binding protein